MEFPTGPTGTSSQSEQQQRSGPQEGGRSRTRRDFPFSVKEEEEEVGLALGTCHPLRRGTVTKTRNLNL